MGDSCTSTAGAYDPDARTTPTKVAVSVDGGTPKTVTADVARQDVATLHPLAGEAHGFDLYLAPAEGSHRICVTALNVSYGSDRSSAAKRSTSTSRPRLPSPRSRPAGPVRRWRGWAVDPDTSTPIDVRLSVDGRAASTLDADTTGTSGSTYRGRQYSVYLPMTSGTHQICAVAVNAGYGTHNSPPACRSITLALSPLGSWRRR